MQCCLKFKKHEPNNSSQEKKLILYIYIYIYIVFKSNTPLPNAQVFFPKINIKTHLLLVTDSDFSFLCSLSLSIFLLHNKRDYESQAPLQPKSRSCWRLGQIFFFFGCCEFVGYWVFYHLLGLMLGLPWTCRPLFFFFWRIYGLGDCSITKFFFSDFSSNIFFWAFFFFFFL